MPSKFEIMAVLALEEAENAATIAAEANTRAMTPGPAGKDGVDGKDGRDGVDGKDGRDGVDGKDGRDGVDGPAGKDGLDGKDGRDGVDGRDGKDGVDGKDGRDGVDGRDGKDGKDGVDGSKWFVENAPTNPIKDDIFLDKNGNVFVYDGTKWIEKINIQGPRGRQGKPGQNGLDGGPGPQGEQGIQGEQGPPGEGSTGPHNDLSGRDASDAHPISAISGLSDALSDVQTQVLGKQPYQGVGNRDDLNLSYSARQITITGAAEIWINGVKATLSNPYTFAAHPDTTGGWFFYFDDNGDPQVSASPWDLITDAPIAYVFYNATLADAIVFYELHTAWRDPHLHYRLHFVDGTQVEEGSGFAASGFVLNSDVNANKAVDISAGRIWDEDIDFDVTATPVSNQYTVFYRTGATGEWTWETVTDYNFLVSGVNIVYNQFTGATWQLTALTGNPQFVNVWAFATTSITPLRQIFFIIGQSVFTSESAAEAESVGNINFGTMPFQEVAPLYQLTYRRATSNGGVGKCDLRRVARLSGTRSAIATTGASPTIAAAVEFLPVGNITATNVQDAIEQVSNTVADMQPYTHVQSVGASTWVVTHNFGSMPSNIFVLDSAATEIYGEVRNPDANTTHILFGSSISGQAILTPS